jgi:uncharacterized protein YlzI (FlbEa/FlbD family)
VIQLTDINGQSIYLAPAAIAVVRETGASSQWHGIRAVVKTFDGRTLEVRESAAEIAAKVQP